MVSYYMDDMQEGSIRFGVFCIRTLYRIMTCCRRCRGETLSISRSLRLPPYKLDEGIAIPTPFVVETWNNGSTSKTWVQYSGESVISHPDPFEHHVHAPWVWFGYRLPTTDEMVDLTVDISEFVLPGNVVKPELVHSYFPKSRFGNIVYVDRESFVVTDLSSSGLVIEDAPIARDIRFSRRVCPASDCTGTGKLD